MFAIGCLALIVLPLLGLVIGGYAAGLEGVKWGAAIGFAIALVLCGVSTWALVKATKGPR